MTHEEFVRKVAEFEGFSATPYKCPAGVLTIGYGFTDKKYTSLKSMTKEQGLAILSKELLSLESKIDNYLLSNNIVLNVNSLYALTSFAYNCGFENLKKLCHVDGNLKKKFRTEKEIGNAILLYNKANGKVLAGLTRRRKWEKELFFSTVTPTKEPTIEELVQTNINIVIHERKLPIEPVEVDGKIGQKTLQAINKILLSL